MDEGAQGGFAGVGKEMAVQASVCIHIPPEVAKCVSPGHLLGTSHRSVC